VAKRSANSGFFGRFWGSAEEATPSHRIEKPGNPILNPDILETFMDFKNLVW
jgi:hypothetical protein